MALLPNLVAAQAASAIEMAADSFGASFLFPDTLVPGEAAGLTIDQDVKSYRFTAYRQRIDDNLASPSAQSTRDVKGKVPQSVSGTIESYIGEAEVHKLDHRMDRDEAESLSAYGFDDWMSDNATALLVHGLLNSRELRARDVAYATANYVSGNTKVVTDSSGSWLNDNVDPLTQIREARALLNRYGATNTTPDRRLRMTFSSDAWDAFTGNPHVREAFFGLAPQEFGLESFRVKLADLLSPNRPSQLEIRVLDASALSEPQKTGTPGTPSLIWSSFAHIQVVPGDSARLKGYGWGRGYRVGDIGGGAANPFAMGTFEVDDTDEVVLRAKTTSSETVFAKQLGYLFRGITTPVT